MNKSICRGTGCLLNIVFFSRRFSNIPDSGLSLFSLGVSVCTHTKQVEHQRCRRTGRVRISQHFKGKTQYLMNTLYLIFWFGHITWWSKIKRDKLENDYPRVCPKILELMTSVLVSCMWEWLSYFVSNVNVALIVAGADVFVSFPLECQCYNHGCRWYRF